MPLFVAAARSRRRRDERSRARAVLATAAHTDGKTLALNAPAGKSVSVRDCAGIRAPLPARALLARLDGSEPRYVLPPLETATIDSYLADDCASAAPYPFSPLTTAAGYLIIGIPNPTSYVTLYLNLAASFSGRLRGGLQEICADCGFDQGTCQPLVSGHAVTVQGPLYGRATLRGSILPTDARRRLGLHRHPKPMTRPGRTPCGALGDPVARGGPVFGASRARRERGSERTASVPPPCDGARVQL